jgi:hypothetical protein
MNWVHRIGIVVIALVLIGVASATAHHIYKSPLSSGYAPILKAVLQVTNQDDRAAYFHRVRVAVQTNKVRESEAKLEERQADFDSSFVMDGSPQNASSILSGMGLDEVQ